MDNIIQSYSHDQDYDQSSQVRGEPITHPPGGPTILDGGLEGQVSLKMEKTGHHTTFDDIKRDGELNADSSEAMYPVDATYLFINKFIKVNRISTGQKTNAQKGSSDNTTKGTDCLHSSPEKLTRNQVNYLLLKGINQIEPMFQEEKRQIELFTENLDQVKCGTQYLDKFAYPPPNNHLIYYIKMKIFNEGMESSQTKKVSNEVNEEWPNNLISKKERTYLDENYMQQIDFSLNYKYKPLECPIIKCNKKFEKRSKLRQHLKCHLQVRFHKCTHPGCDKSFKLPQHLSYHLTTHQKDKNQKFICSYPDCGREFRQNWILRDHEKTHQNVYKFHCIYEGCTKKYNTRSNLEVHLRKHVGVRPFVCNECGKQYISKWNMVKHKKKGCQRKVRVNKPKGDEAQLFEKFLDVVQKENKLGKLKAKSGTETTNQNDDKSNQSDEEDKDDIETSFEDNLRKISDEFIKEESERINNKSNGQSKIVNMQFMKKLKQIFTSFDSKRMRKKKEKKEQKQDQDEIEPDTIKPKQAIQESKASSEMIKKRKFPEIDQKHLLQTEMQIQHQIDSLVNKRREKEYLKKIRKNQVVMCKQNQDIYNSNLDGKNSQEEAQGEGHRLTHSSVKEKSQQLSPNASQKKNKVVFFYLNKTPKGIMIDEESNSKISPFISASRRNDFINETQQVKTIDMERKISLSLKDASIGMNSRTSSVDDSDQNHNHNQQKAEKSIENNDEPIDMKMQEITSAKRLRRMNSQQDLINNRPSQAVDLDSSFSSNTSNSSDSEHQQKKRLKQEQIRIKKQQRAIRDDQKIMIAKSPPPILRMSSPPARIAPREDMSKKILPKVEEPFQRAVQKEPDNKSTNLSGCLKPMNIVDMRKKLENSLKQFNQKNDLIKAPIDLNVKSQFGQNNYIKKFREPETKKNISLQKINNPEHRSQSVQIQSRVYDKIKINKINNDLNIGGQQNSSYSMQKSSKQNVQIFPFKVAIDRQIHQQVHSSYDLNSQKKENFKSEFLRQNLMTNLSPPLQTNTQAADGVKQQNNSIQYSQNNAIEFQTLTVPQETRSQNSKTMVQQNLKPVQSFKALQMSQQLRTDISVSQNPPLSTGVKSFLLQRKNSNAQTVHHQQLHQQPIIAQQPQQVIYLQNSGGFVPGQIIGQPIQVHNFDQQTNQSNNQSARQSHIQVYNPYQGQMVVLAPGPSNLQQLIAAQPQPIQMMHLPQPHNTIIQPSIVHSPFPIQAPNQPKPIVQKVGSQESDQMQNLRQSNRQKTSIEMQGGQQIQTINQQISERMSVNNNGNSMSCDISLGHSSITQRCGGGVRDTTHNKNALYHHQIMKVKALSDMQTNRGPRNLKIFKLDQRQYQQSKTRNLISQQQPQIKQQNLQNQQLSTVVSQQIYSQNPQPLQQMYVLYPVINDKGNQNYVAQNQIIQQPQPPTILYQNADGTTTPAPQQPQQGVFQTGGYQTMPMPVIYATPQTMPTIIQMPIQPINQVAMQPITTIPGQAQSQAGSIKHDKGGNQDQPVQQQPSITLNVNTSNPQQILMQNGGQTLNQNHVINLGNKNPSNRQEMQVNVQYPQQQRTNSMTVLPMQQNGIGFTYETEHGHMDPEDIKKISGNIGSTVVNNIGNTDQNRQISDLWQQQQMQHQINRIQPASHRGDVISQHQYSSQQIATQQFTDPQQVYIPMQNQNQ